MPNPNDDKKIVCTQCAKELANKATLKNHLLTKHQWLYEEDRPASPETFARLMEKRAVSKKQTTASVQERSDLAPPNREAEASTQPEGGAATDDDIKILISDNENDDVEPDRATTDQPNLPKIQKNMAVINWSMEPIALN